jgi:hypothetical protein
MYTRRHCIEHLCLEVKIVHVMFRGKDGDGRDVWDPKILLAISMNMLLVMRRGAKPMCTQIGLRRRGVWVDDT